jgi:hypothetical protein
MAYIFFEEHLPAGKMIYMEGLSCADILRLGSDITVALNLLTDLKMPYYDIHMPNILYNHNHFMLCDLCYIGEFNQKLMNEAKNRLYNLVQNLLKKSNSHLSDMLLKLHRQNDQENIYEKLLLENISYASQNRYVFDNSDATLIFGKTEKKRAD